MAAILEEEELSEDDSSDDESINNLLKSRKNQRLCVQPPAAVAEPLTNEDWKGAMLNRVKPSKNIPQGGLTFGVDKNIALAQKQSTKHSTQQPDNVSNDENKLRHIIQASKKKSAYGTKTILLDDTIPRLRSPDEKSQKSKPSGLLQVSGRLNQ